MKCKFCGDKMSRSDNICSSCGKLKSKPLDQKSDYSERKAGRFVDYFPMTKNMLCRYMVPFGIVVMGIVFFNIVPAIEKEIMICIDIIAVIVAVLIVISASRSYVSVYSNCVYGIIPCKIPLFTKRFTVYYDDVIKVKAFGMSTNSAMTRHGKDSHPKFVIITDFGAIDIKGLDNTQAIHLRDHIRYYTESLKRM